MTPALPALNWSSLDDFLAMGGQAFPVWGSIGLVAMFVVFEIASLRRRHRAALRAVASSSSSSSSAPRKAPR